MPGEARIRSSRRSKPPSSLISERSSYTPRRDGRPDPFAVCAVWMQSLRLRGADTPDPLSSVLICGAFGCALGGLTYEYTG